MLNVFQWKNKNARFGNQSRIYSISGIFGPRDLRILKKNGWRFCFLKWHCAIHQGIFPKINYSFKLHYILSLCYLRFSPIESLYYMLTLSVVSSVLSCSQPSCCHREKNSLHFSLSFAEEASVNFPVWLCWS